MTDTPILYDYWRSSASYRVRIALNLLGRPYEAAPVDLLAGTHRGPDYLAMNPQGLLPSLSIDGHLLTQSLAIIEYLHATTVGSSLLPVDPLGQFRVRQLSYAVALEIHPICNLSVATHAAYLTKDVDAAKTDWMTHFIARGLGHLEALLAQDEQAMFSYGDTPTLADCCLIPQLYNADRWGVDYSVHRRIAQIAEATRDISAFSDAYPDRVGPPVP
ncbi:MAG: maleylacetoacetate isomerase [Octadecabacter sp.]